MFKFQATEKWVMVVLTDPNATATFYRKVQPDVALSTCKACGQ